MAADLPVAVPAVLAQFAAAFQPLPAPFDSGTVQPLFDLQSPERLRAAWACMESEGGLRGRLQEAAAEVRNFPEAEVVVKGFPTEAEVVVLSCRLEALKPEEEEVVVARAALFPAMIRQFFWPAFSGRPLVCQ